MEREKIIICEKCQGKGYIEKSRITSYHKGEYNYWNEQCDQCEGSGRTIKTIRITTRPFYLPSTIEIRKEKEDV